MPPTMKSPARAAERWAGAGRGGRPDRASTGGMRAIVRAGHHAAPAAVTTASSPPAASSHHGTLKASTR